MGSQPTSVNKQNSDVTLKIQAEQVNLLFAAMPTSVIATLINATIIVIVQWSVIEHTHLIIWLSAMVCIMLARGLLAYVYKLKRPPIDEIRPWLNGFILGTVLVAIVWGASSIWLFPLDSVGHQVFLAFVMAGMTAGATTSLSFLPVPIIVYLVLALIPLSIRFFMLGDILSLAMGSMTLVFLAMVLVSSLRIYKNTRENILLRIEANQREKAFRRGEEKYRHIFNTSPLGIVHYDQYGVITDYNQTFQQIIGAKSSDLKRLDMFHTTSDNRFQDALRQSIKGHAAQFEGSSDAIISNKNRDMRVFFSGIQASDDEVQGGVAIVEDISEENRIKKLKDEFVSTVSHELRTPLTAIRGALGLVQGGVTGELSDTTRDMLEITNTNTERLLLLINDILDIDKLDAGKMKFNLQPLKVMGFLHDAVHATETYAKQFKVRFEIGKQIGDEIEIKADRERLMQVMYNLLSNAAKFSPENSIVTINSETSMANTVVINIIDQGPGIAEEFQDSIFERFTQLDSSDSRRTGGTGLGLSISKAIIENHDGNIGFNSNENGTRFYIELPACYS